MRIQHGPERRLRGQITAGNAVRTDHEISISAGNPKAQRVADAGAGGHIRHDEIGLGAVSHKQRSCGDERDDSAGKRGGQGDQLINARRKVAAAVVSAYQIRAERSASTPLPYCVTFS